MHQAVWAGVKRFGLALLPATWSPIPFEQLYPGSRFDNWKSIDLRLSNQDHLGLPVLQTGIILSWRLSNRNHFGLPV
jgi:hypothetical protein